jgi:hypothetical protein
MDQGSARAGAHSLDHPSFFDNSTNDFLDVSALDHHSRPVGLEIIGLVDIFFDPFTSRLRQGDEEKINCHGSRSGNLERLFARNGLYAVSFAQLLA